MDNEMKGDNLFTVLPRLLDEALNDSSFKSKFVEITSKERIGKLDKTVSSSYNLVVADQSEQVTGVIEEGKALPEGLHSIWMYQDPKDRTFTYGKYVHCKSDAEGFDFWIGFVKDAQDSNICLWFGKEPKGALLTKLKQSGLKGKTGCGGWLYFLDLSKIEKKLLDWLKNLLKDLLSTLTEELIEQLLELIKQLLKEVFQ